MITLSVKNKIEYLYKVFDYLNGKHTKIIVHCCTIIQYCIGNSLDKEERLIFLDWFREQEKLAYEFTIKHYSENSLIKWNPKLNPNTLSHTDKETRLVSSWWVYKSITCETLKQEVQVRKDFILYLIDELQKELC